MKISELLDESQALPTELLNELSECEECHSFYQMWYAGSNLDQVAGQMPRYQLKDDAYTLLADSIESQNVIEFSDHKPTSLKNWLVLSLSVAAVVAVLIVTAIQLSSVKQGATQNEVVKHVPVEVPEVLPENTESPPSFKITITDDQIRSGVAMINFMTSRTSSKTVTKVESAKTTMQKTIGVASGLVSKMAD